VGFVTLESRRDFRRLEFSIVRNEVTGAIEGVVKQAPTKSTGCSARERNRAAN